MATQNKKCIFLVDDEPIQNEMLKDYLSERFDYDIKTYESGEAAIKEMHLNPDIIVLDFHLSAHLPDAKNGVEVLKEMKKIAPGTQVIMLSGQDKLEVAVDSMKYGAYDYVVKSETAFSRMENIFNNINELRGLKVSHKTYKTITYLLFAAIVILVIFSAYLVQKLDVSMPVK